MLQFCNENLLTGEKAFLPSFTSKNNKWKCKVQNTKTNSAHGLWLNKLWKDFISEARSLNKKKKRASESKARGAEVKQTREQVPELENPKFGAFETSRSRWRAGWRGAARELHSHYN